VVQITRPDIRAPALHPAEVDVQPSLLGGMRVATGDVCMAVMHPVHGHPEQRSALNGEVSTDRNRPFQP
jgi:hypothetical protein